MTSTATDLPSRFWFQAIAAGLGSVLFVFTLVSREWVEILTGFEPDGGSGALEFGLAFALLAVAVLSAVFARRTFVAATAA